MSGQAVQIAAVTELPDGQVPHAAAVAANDAYTAKLHTSLEAVRPLWLRLQAQGVCTGHQNFAWAEGIVARLLPEGAQLLLVEVSDAATGETRMLVPLMRRKAFHHWVVEWLSCGVCDYAAPLLADDTPWTKQSAQAAWAALCSVLPPVDRVHIEGVPRQIQGVANPLALLPATRDSIQTTFGLAIDGDPETVLKRLCRPSFVKEFGKDWRRLERLGGVELVEARAPAEVERIFGELVRMRLDRFRELGRFDLLTQDKIVDFYRNAAIQGLLDGSVRLFGLLVGEALISVQYLLVHEGTVHALLIAMDQSVVPNVSPGLAIMGRLIGWARERGFGYFDLSVGNQSYKEHMGAKGSVLVELCHGLTMRGSLASTAIELRRGAEAFIRSKPRLLKAVQGTMRGLRRLRG
ncbi:MULTISPECIES: GNAT family N-acetyltransferase [unclassified Mesorhizobium]|uniref:GNAT family N-acetyltransferase n=1 Tax=unclassified Mesorhizobium TaxID=325217 RepID=UPI00112C60C1|nr:MULTISPECIES: GNAT family N-acetyltransferase [unclassified Mesorhizobium]MBZ9742128.1 GNAT family N-acetyltransferase [Mesorhizobium sp. CO1-1-4]MBZ9804769.1 GNAT family N-acetyltransferase [Mesorhizobium sp. ES1-6]TPL86123.1 GNAT family N-acetyltransferase [Mesorhizobium sp. B2-3-12]